MSDSTCMSSSQFDPVGGVARGRIDRPAAFLECGDRLPLGGGRVGGALDDAAPAVDAFLTAVEN